MAVSPRDLIRAICPPGTKQVSIRSSGPLGTAYGQWLGLQYVLWRRLSGPVQSYVLVDFKVWRGSEWPSQTIYDLYRYDPQVVLALTSSEWARRGLKRVDILDSDFDDVYEIKPLRSADAGPDQLDGYLRELRKVAKEASRTFDPAGRLRLWQGGGWDPTPYVLVVPSLTGEVMFIHAKKHETTRGVIVYDFVSCRRRPDEVAQFADTRLRSVVGPLAELRPRLNAALAVSLPKAPVDSTYALVVPHRFFEVFVKGVWDRQIDRDLGKAFGVRPGPAVQAFVLSTWAGALALRPELTLAATLATGYMPRDEVVRAYVGTKLAQVAAGAALLAGLLVLPEVLAASGVDAVAGIGIGATAALAAAEPVGTATPEVGDGAAVANTVEVDVGEAVVVGTQGTPWLLGAGAVNASADAMIGGPGLVGAFAIGAVSTFADAATGQNPGVPDGIAVADPLYLVPAELLIPKKGRIAAGAEVLFGDERYFIIGVVDARGVTTL